MATPVTQTDERQLAARLQEKIKASKPVTTQKPSWLAQLSRANLALTLFSYILIVHVLGLYVFTQGFLLSRVSLPTTSPAYDEGNPKPFPARFDKAIVIVIDALRTDFISPIVPNPASPYHHNVLSLPSELTANNPSHSLIFNAFSDPPTTTMQRIKGITTGSLPTFIDASANFASNAILEDSIISQLVTANKSVGFMGDDTWLGLFPDSFAEGMSHPYDSFNVEDLHTVDEGVIEHLIPALQSANQSSWDVLIGHFLGVDHVGHRVGPSRDTMRLKLEQMNSVLTEVVSLMRDDTLLIVLGDHGMDEKGNHGGDGELETASALWMYSKGPALTNPYRAHAKVKGYSVVGAEPTYIFPGTTESLRSVNQIDLVPTLSLLLGVPIPFNNLGTPIPELFVDAGNMGLRTLVSAFEATSKQILRYLGAYGDGGLLDDDLLALSVRAKASSGLVSRKVNTKGPFNFDGFLEEQDRLFEGDHLDQGLAHASFSLTCQRGAIQAHQAFAKETLTQLRALWAEFSPFHMIVGLSLLVASILALWALYVGVRRTRSGWHAYVSVALEMAVKAGLLTGSVVGSAVGFHLRSPSAAIQSAVVTSAFISEVVLFLPIVAGSLRNPSAFIPSLSSLQTSIGPIILILHTASFASNSFVMWEDRMVSFLLATIPILGLIKAWTAPTSAMRLKIFGFSALGALCIRVAGASTVCREEQQPYCHVTFYAGVTSPVAPSWVFTALLPLAAAIPAIVQVFLSSSRSYSGPAPFFVGKIMRSILVGNSFYWLLEFAETWDQINPLRAPLINSMKLWLARGLMGMTLGAATYTWSTMPLCIEVHREQEIDQTGQPMPQQQVTVYGFANAYGSSYLLFFLIPFSLVHLTLPPTGQVMLSVLLVSLLAHLESVDAQRDAKNMKKAFSSASSPGAFDPAESAAVQPTFTEIVPLALMGFVAFFATGHQAVLTSIHWKAAFVGFSSVTYPWSPILVGINTWGPFALSALAIPLLSLWNLSPKPNAESPVLADTVQSSLGFLLYHSLTTTAAAACAAWLRRHLMVWKVFAPRYMLAGVTLVIADVAIILAVSVGFRAVSWKVRRTFRAVDT